MPRQSAHLSGLTGVRGYPTGGSNTASSVGTPAFGIRVSNARPQHMLVVPNHFRASACLHRPRDSSDSTSDPPPAPEHDQHRYAQQRQALRRGMRRPRSLAMISGHRPAVPRFEACGHDVHTTGFTGRWGEVGWVGWRPYAS